MPIFRKYDRAGRVIDFAAGEVYVLNDPNLAPRLETLPKSDFLIPVWVVAGDGKLRLAAASPKTIATATQLAAQEAKIKEAKEEAGKKVTLVELAEQTLTYQAALALVAGNRTIVKTGVTGLKSGDRVFCLPKDPLPAGYMLGDSVSPANGTLNVTVNTPALALLAQFSFVVRVIVLR